MAELILSVGFIVGLVVVSAQHFLRSSWLAQARVELLLAFVAAALTYLFIQDGLYWRAVCCAVEVSGLAFAAYASCRAHIQLQKIEHYRRHLLWQMNRGEQ